MVKKIVTHVNPRHLDDTLAVALLAYKYPEAQIEYIHPQNDKEKIEKYLNDSSIICVDIGGKYNPKFKNYDHHQDKNVECSLVLILKHEFPELYEFIKKHEILSKEMKYIDIKDRFGLKEAQKLGVSNLFIEEAILLKMAENPENMQIIGKAFYDKLNEMLQEYKNLQQIEIINYNGYKIAIDKIGIRFTTIVNNLDVDLVIQRNVFDKSDTSIIKDTSKEKTKNIDFNKLREKYSIKFIHQAGFIAVIAKSIEELNIKELIRDILG